MEKEHIFEDQDTKNDVAWYSSGIAGPKNIGNIIKCCIYGNNKKYHCLN